MGKNKYYAFKASGKSGVADSWPECESAVKGVTGAKYKGFSTREEAFAWLDAGADYAVKHVNLEPGIYFDAGTGAGNGVEISVTDEHGKSLLHEILPAAQINERGFHLLGEGVTNNYGELLALKYAIGIAERLGVKKIFGDSKLVIEFWSKWRIKTSEVAEETAELAKAVAFARQEYEKGGGTVERISGGRNPADLGFHKG